MTCQLTPRMNRRWNGSPTPQKLAVHLRDLKQQYDMETILEVLETINHG